MLCLSGFELYSRWVPLVDLTRERNETYIEDVWESWDVWQNSQIISDSKINAGYGHKRPPFTTSKRQKKLSTLSCNSYSLQYLQIWLQQLHQGCQEFRANYLHHTCRELEASWLTMAKI